MKNAIFIMSCTVLFLACKPQKKNDLESLSYFKKVLWPKAYREQNVNLLDSLLADEFQMIDDQGNWFSKADEIEYIRNNKPSYDSFNYELKRLEIFEDHTAVAAGVGTIINLKNGQKEVTTYQSSNILIKRDGQWKAISSHVSGIKAH